MFKTHWTVAIRQQIAWCNMLRYLTILGNQVESDEQNTIINWADIYCRVIYCIEL